MCWQLPSQRLFAARAGRLALSREGVSELVPCAMAVEGGKLPLTSVYATYVPRRIFVGAVSEISERDDDLHHYTFTVDLQVCSPKQWMAQWACLEGLVQNDACWHILCALVREKEGVLTGGA